MINFAVLSGGLGDDVAVALDSLQQQSQGAIKAVRSDVPLAPYRNAVLAIMQRIESTLDWAPRSLASVAQTMMDRYQTFPVLNAYGLFSTKPVWLKEDYQQKGWAEVVAAYKPIASAFLAKQMGAVSAEGDRLASNVAFWDTVGKYSGATYLQEVWDKLWDAIAALKANVASAKAALNQSHDVIQQYGSRVPSGYVSDFNSVSAQYDAAISKAKSTLAPLGSRVQQEAGLGAVALVIIGIGAAVVIAVTAGVWAVVNEFTSIQRQANGNAADLLKWRDAQDAADFAAGRITNDQLQSRRAATSAAATELVKNQGAAQIGGALKDAGSGFGTSLGISLGVVALLGLGGLYLYKRLG
jgi:hypothetical protein